jgi:hypothetical protein
MRKRVSATSPPISSTPSRTVLAPSSSLLRYWIETEQMTRAQAAGPAPLMRSAPRPSPVLFQWVTTSKAHPACWQTPWMAWRTAPMSYRFDPLAPAAARYSGSRTTRTAGCASSSAWMAASWTCSATGAWSRRPAPKRSAPRRVPSGPWHKGKVKGRSGPGVGTPAGPGPLP